MHPFTDQINGLLASLRENNHLFGEDVFFSHPEEENTRSKELTDQRVNYCYITPSIPTSGRSTVIRKDGMTPYAYFHEGIFRVIVVFSKANPGSVYNFVLSKVSQVIGVEAIGGDILTGHIYADETNEPLPNNTFSAVRLFIRITKRTEIYPNCIIEICETEDCL